MRAWRKSRSIQTRLFVTRKYSKNLSQKRKNGQASEDLTHIVISVITGNSETIHSTSSHPLLVESAPGRF